MKFKQTVLGTAAVTGILFGLAAFSPPAYQVSSPANADTNISVNFGFGNFYDELQPYGNWVLFEDRFVFIPQKVNRGWRPYTVGHWSYTKRYGWLWVSDERFGWATYHYGRWGYSREIGWYWVPGHRWAPAWVVWNHGRNEIAWAPLPPRRGRDFDVDVNITIGDVPDYYWQAVPTSSFLSINLSTEVIRDREHVRTIIQQGKPETVHIENNIVINNVIQVNEVEKATNTKVKVLEEKSATTPAEAGKTDDNSVAIFNPEVKADASAKPKKAAKVEEIITERKSQGIEPTDVPAEQAAAEAPKLDKNGKPIVSADKPVVETQTPGDKPKADAPAEIKQENTVTATKKPVDAPAENADKAVTDAPVDKSKKKKVVEDTVAPKDAQQEVQPQQSDQKPTDQKQKKKKNATQTDQQPVDENAAAPSKSVTPPADAKSDEPPAKKGKKGKEKCDANLETCPPAE